MEIVIIIGHVKVVYFPSLKSTIRDIIRACESLAAIGIPAKVELREREDWAK